MNLMTKEIEKNMPGLYEQERKGEEAIVYVKLFCPWNHWTWYVTEYDPEEKLFFGYVRGDFDEWGYFSLEELENIQGPFGLKIERDLSFEPKKLNQILIQAKQNS